ncbi:LysR family transcriptional regulator [uncultured Sphingomonas sp.]|uniref:LysR family transcriptional regulator n=1 Tax=uncultured Sphingomonas sp. TaxID=158754 RepID=UPI0035CC9531
MNIRFLETLVWLTRLRSFSRTAEKLNTTQPAVSSRINKLEELLGVQLYDRGERRFELTQAGRRILRHAEEIVTLSAELSDLARTENVFDTPVSIGVIEMVTMSWLPLFIGEVTAAMPTATLYFGTGTSRQLIQELRDDRMDLIFVVGPLDEPHVATRPVCILGQDWTANPRAFDCESPIDVVELSRLQVILQRTGSSGYDMMMEYFKSYGILNMPVREGRLTIDCAYSMVTAIELVKAGLAIMPLPPALIRDHLARGDLSPMNVRQALPSVNIVACWKRPLKKPLVEHLTELACQAVATYAETCDPAHLRPT